MALELHMSRDMLLIDHDTLASVTGGENWTTKFDSWVDVVNPDFSKNSCTAKAGLVGAGTGTAIGAIGLASTPWTGAVGPGVAGLIAPTAGWYTSAKYLAACRADEKAHGQPID